MHAQGWATALLAIAVMGCTGGPEATTAEDASGAPPDTLAQDGATSSPDPVGAEAGAGITASDVCGRLAPDVMSAVVGTTLDRAEVRLATSCVYGLQGFAPDDATQPAVAVAVLDAASDPAAAQAEFEAAYGSMEDVERPDLPGLTVTVVTAVQPDGVPITRLSAASEANDLGVEVWLTGGSADDAWVTSGTALQVLAAVVELTRAG